MKPNTNAKTKQSQKWGENCKNCDMQCAVRKDQGYLLKGIDKKIV